MRKQTEGTLSVIIPIAKDDETWRSLLPQLVQLKPIAEIIISSTEDEPAAFKDFSSPAKTLLWIKGPAGRALQQNLGAKKARSDWLWFLHADSVLIDGTQSNIERTIASDISGIHYFDLKFLTNCPSVMYVNEAGAWFRSRVLRIPFGDQGFLIKKEIFDKLGHFDEDAKFGEDHLLVWKAHQLGYAVRSIKFPIGTSARKYQQNGWLQTTAKHVRLTAAQALPEAIKTLRERWISGRK